MLAHEAGAGRGPCGAAGPSSGSRGLASAADERHGAPSAARARRRRRPPIPARRLPRVRAPHRHRAEGVGPTQRTHTLSFEGGAPVAPAPADLGADARSREPRNRPSGGGAARGDHGSGLAPRPRARRSGSATPHHRGPGGADGDPPYPGRRAPWSARRSPPSRPTNGHLGGKLDELGLLAAAGRRRSSHSRASVVERVVWEVVPALAEALHQRRRRSCG